MKLFEHTFAVQGTGDFPIDMLRFERSYPATESDSNRIVSPTSEPRVVWLKRRSMTKPFLPETARWKSFRWEVVENSVTVQPL